MFNKCMENSKNIPLKINLQHNNVCKKAKESQYFLKPLYSMYVILFVCICSYVQSKQYHLNFSLVQFLI